MRAGSPTKRAAIEAGLRADALDPALVAPETLDYWCKSQTPAEEIVAILVLGQKAARRTQEGRHPFGPECRPKSSAQEALNS